MKLLGEWNRTLPAAWAQIATAAVGFWCAATGRPWATLICLIVATVFDLLDIVLVARGERSPQAADFGRELNLMADMVGFVGLPIAATLAFGMTQWPVALVLAAFLLGGVIRLAQVGIDQGRALREPVEPATGFRGFPVAYSGLVFAPLGAVRPWLSAPMFTGIWLVVMIVMTAAFVIDFRLRFPGRGDRIAQFAVMIVSVVALSLWTPGSM